jgi:radical SAM superfamily enzyme YgiQ (UPF0313 family)
MNVLLVSFYNPKALGLRYLERALVAGGHDVRLVFFKGFNSANPLPATGKELSLLRAAVTDYRPGLIGLSVMASHYMDTVYAVSSTLRESFNIPVVWGGAYASLDVEKCIPYCDYLLRGEGEDAIIELADAIQNKTPVEDIQNLVYHTPDGYKINELRMLETNLDKYGLPQMGDSNRYLIENDRIEQRDPQLTAASYETGASRGCPFACTYCSAISLHRMNKGKGSYVRFRDADSVIDEVKNAKAKMKNLVVVHFWDEVFSDDDAWVDRFVERYKKEIDLPFEIWGHPLKTNAKLITKLRKAGLHKVVMGIQSGSTYIRRDIFRRPESQEDILKATRVLKECGVPQIVYDFMLRHPFETPETIRETYELCTQFPRGFELNMHGLNFLPGTDIIGMAIERGLVSEEDMQKMMHAPMREQYNMHWARDNANPLINFWYHLIYLTQYASYRGLAKRLAQDPENPENQREAERAYVKAEKLEKPRYYWQKARIILKGKL